MSTLKLLDSGATAYTFDPTPKVEIASARLAVGDGDRQGVKTTWTITGRLIGDAAALVSKRDALETAFSFGDDKNKSLQLSKNSTVLDTLSDADYKGLRVEQPAGYPQGAGVQWATIRDYTLVCSATVLDSGLAKKAWGASTRNEQMGADGQKHIVITGEFTGPEAQDAADAEKLSTNVIVLSERQTTDDDQDKVSFEYHYIGIGSGDSREVISFTETISVTQGGQDFVMVPILGGGNPIKQDTVVRTWRATQAGSAVGRTGYPSFPAKKYLVSYLRPESTEAKAAPKLTQDGALTEYGIQWNYVYEFNVAGALADPNTPPTGTT